MLDGLTTFISTVVERWPARLFQAAAFQRQRCNGLPTNSNGWGVRASHPHPSSRVATPSCPFPWPKSDSSDFGTQFCRISR